MLKLTLVALGNKMPDWVVKGCDDYVKRFKDGVAFKVIEIPLERRSKSSDLSRILEKETTLIKEVLPNGARCIALDVEGQTFSSEGLALKITKLQHIASHLCFIIGGPEGLSQEILNACEERWSLSKLTLPHPIARLVLIETLYRAWSMINNHPYHKA